MQKLQTNRKKKDEKKKTYNPLFCSIHKPLANKYIKSTNTIK